MVEEDAKKEKTLEMRVAELEDRMSGMQVTEEEMQTFNKVASMLGTGARADSPAGLTPVPSNCVVQQCTVGPCVINQCSVGPCVINQCTVRPCTIVNQCTIRPCTVINQCTIQQCIGNCINECGGGAPGGGFGGGFGGLGE